MEGIRNINLEDYMIREDDETENWSAKMQELIQIHREITVKTIDIIEKTPCIVTFKTFFSRMHSMKIQSLRNFKR